ncbi:sterol carrier family protein [Streptomyces olivoreticuli]|uniref:maleylpyruvate isomerase family mycothiol-dependent enzyme n=1 Tax=Streptomyces olivoreticuli TaxID=68246 RepID=UPI00265A20D4|nr:maleylpyruvate isomerase family mycothiol-dependent enzyme [Streptomyces olivoreticuli]WKK20995.1 sterol carrier family protein [Streptomyces olivoreticuli]
MPPAQRKRARTYDLDRTRAAVIAQLGNVRAVVEALDEGRFALPTRLGDWTVRELVTHIALGVRSVTHGLGQPAPPAREITLAEWPFATADYATQVATSVREADAEDPVALLAQVADRFAELTSGVPADRLLTARPGVMRLDDLLVTRCVELVVHSDDLAAALGVDIPFDRQALAAVTRLLADSLAVKAPGGSVEVRVPPFAVVQCVAGPKHTRGTPPNVVETDPLTWVRLATGRTDWATALDAAAVSASGERADISEQLPLLT